MFIAGGLARVTIEASPSSRQGVGAAATVFVFLYTMIFGATWLTVPWLYPAEIFPLQVRARGNAWGVVGWSIGNGWTVSVSVASAWNPIDMYDHRCCFYRPSLRNSMKRPYISLVGLISCAFSLCGPFIQSQTRGHWKKWISYLQATAFGTGTRKEILLSLKLSIRNFRSQRDVLAAISR